MRIGPVSQSVDHAAGWAWRLLVLGALVAASLYLVWQVRVIVLPSLVALTIAPALMPIVGFLRARGLGRAAPAIALLVGVLIVGGLIALVAVALVDQWDELADTARDGFDELVGLVGTERPLADSEVIDAIRDNAYDYAVRGALGALGIVTGLVLAVVLLYFVLRDGTELWAWILRRVPEHSRADVDAAGSKSWRALGGFIRGTALIALIDAVLIGLGLWIIGVPLVLALAVLVFLGGFVPFIGATVAGIAAVLVAFADGGWQQALIALAIVLGVQFIEGNFLQPHVQSRTVGLHPAVILLAVAAGASLFGFIGAYLAVPVTAVTFTMIEALGSSRADSVAEET